MKNLLIRFLFVTIGFVNLSNGQTITIGSQVWMTKNLDVSTFRNGDSIPEVKTDEEWKKAGENKQPAWCYYNNDPNNGEKYGKLYNWHAVNDPRGLAPEGWHIPSVTEWDSIINLLGGEEIAGGKMKSKEGWSNNYNGTDESGFGGLPGGCRLIEGDFVEVKGFTNLNGSDEAGWWWSSSLYLDANYDWKLQAWGIDIGGGRRNIPWDDVGVSWMSQELGQSVRCVKD